MSTDRKATEVECKKILVLGQNPSSKNDEKIRAFVGTQSGVRLCEWLWHAGVHKFILSNLVDYTTKDNAPLKQSEISRVAKSSEFRVKLAQYEKIIAVGRQAEKAIKLSGMAVKYIYIPHPSGKNRKLNEPNADNKVIETIKVFVDNGIKV